MDPRIGKYYIDGKDLWTTFGIFVESGSDTFLQFPKRKESITHDWLDSNGLDVDTSRVFFEARTPELKFSIIAANEADFWNFYTGWLAEWAKPGTRRITISEFEKDFYVIYQECSSFTRFTRIKDGYDRFVACKFTIRLMEPDPNINKSQVFLVDEAGRYIIT